MKVCACGSPAIIFFSGHWIVQCLNCGVRKNAISKHEAVALWDDMVSKHKKSLEIIQGEGNV